MAEMECRFDGRRLKNWEVRELGIGGIEDDSKTGMKA